MFKKNIKVGTLSLLCLTTLKTFAALPIDLNQEKISILRSFLPLPVPGPLAQSNQQLTELNRTIDFNKTLHIRVQQTYLGYPVLNGNATIHIPQGKNGSHLRKILTEAGNTKETNMDGMLYQDLSKDLNPTPSIVFSAEQAKKALEIAQKQAQLSPGAEIKKTAQCINGLYR